MATISAAAGGNWFTAATWTGLVVPGETNGQSDVADLNGCVVVFDIATHSTIPSSGSTGTLSSIQSTGKAGQLSVALDIASCSITATTITAGTAPATGGIILVIGATANVLTINANIVGGSNASAYGVNHTGTGTVNITGTITGGIDANANGVFNTSTGAVNVTGSSTGATAAGFRNQSSGTVTVSGACTAGTGGNVAYGFYNVSTGTVTVGSAAGSANSHGFFNASNATATVTGNITGGTVAAKYGFYNDSNATKTVTVNGTITGGSNATAYGFFNELAGTVVAAGIIASTGIGFYNNSTGTVTTGAITGAANVGFYNKVAGAVPVTGNITGGSAVAGIGFNNVTTGVVTLNSCNLINSANAVAFAGTPPTTWNLGTTNYTQWGATKFYYDVPDVANVRDNDTVAGVAGTIATQTLSDANDTVAAGYYAATTLHAVDADLAVGNIATGKTIFGFAGTSSAGGGGARYVKW